MSQSVQNRPFFLPSTYPYRQRRLTLVTRCTPKTKTTVMAKARAPARYRLDCQLRNPTCRLCLTWKVSLIRLELMTLTNWNAPGPSLHKVQKKNLHKSKSKKQKARLEGTKTAKATPSKLNESVISDLNESPATAFARTVNENTGFSPLNPTVPLQEDFGVLSLQTPPPSKPVLAVQILPQPCREFLRDPSAPPTRPQSPSEVELEKPSIPELPSPIPPIPDAPAPPARPPFESVRPALFQKAFFDSINGAKFDDTQIYLCSAQSKAAVAHKPMVVHVRSDFLHAASAIFTDGTCTDFFPAESPS